MTHEESTQTRNIAALSRELKVSRQTLYTWEKHGCPLDSGADAIRAWHREKYGEDDGDAPLSDQLTRRKIRKTEAEAYRVELDNQEREGELVPRDDIIQEFAQILTEAKQVLDALPDDMAKEMPQEIRVTVYEIAKNAVDRFYRKLAAWRPLRDP